jgi:O-antigen/teichoic acid export membrane protein
VQIFKNALWVYAHKTSTALITLVSTPIILRNLGVEYYGIYTLTIGLVALFGFINWSLTTSTQRFITVGFVNEDKDDLIKTFSTSFFIHLAYGLLLLLMILTFGFFFTESFLDIPIDKIEIAKKVLVFVAFISFFQMIGIPFQGLLQAYENLKIVSIIGVMDSILKLNAAFLLFIAPFNKLIFFSLLMAISAFVVYLVYFIYCRKNYAIISLSYNYFSKNKFREMMGFTSWNIIGAVAMLGRNQGMAVVLNIFFGVVANAAYGVALQIQAALGVFSQGIVAAMTPRILKSAGRNEEKVMLNNAYLTAKYGLFVMSFVCVPLLINMDNILSLWLRIVPDNAVIFSKLIIVFLLCTAFSVGIQTIFHGINKVKVYNITISSILLLNIPIAAILFTFDFPAYSIFLVSISLEVVSFFVRLLLLKKHIAFSPINYLFKLSKEVVIPFFSAYLIVSVISNQMNHAIIQLFTTSILSTLILGIIFYFLSISSDEKKRLKPLLNKILFIR